MAGTVKELADECTTRGPAAHGENPKEVERVVCFRRSLRNTETNTAI
jgi:hypothetical protein